MEPQHYPHTQRSMFALSYQQISRHYRHCLAPAFFTRKKISHRKKASKTINNSKKHLTRFYFPLVPKIPFRPPSIFVWEIPCFTTLCNREDRTLSNWMDWGNVTAEDLIDALREVDWSSPPRPLPEFFSRFTVPRSSAKWNSRFKCNLYYYRTNYFILIVVIVGLGFLRKPLSVLAAILTALSIAFLNDSEKVTRTVRQLSPHLAAKMRPPLTPVIRGRPSTKRIVHICGQPRWVFVVIFSSVSFILWYVSCGLLTVLWALAVALLAILLHASFRTPNLKARLNTFREEFRAVWRNYSEL
ncbi:hypothetical protein V6N12_014626 [Hibiscus sabdariffa]|uniref:PRA1 family protein n=1 Tax=Hibiscus sabdariffa TaxID=183260 RepID=A0ABR2DLU4_9ROSI